MPINRVFYFSLLLLIFLGCSDESIDYPQKYNYSGPSINSSNVFVVESSSSALEISPEGTFMQAEQLLLSYLPSFLKDDIGFHFDCIELLSENEVRVVGIVNHEPFDSTFSYSTSDEQLLLDFNSNYGSSFVLNDDNSLLSICYKVILKALNNGAGVNYDTSIALCKTLDFEESLNTELNATTYTSGDTIGIYFFEFEYLYD